MQVNYRVTGAGEPLLLVYGAGEDAELLQPQADALAARGLRVISYDRRGTGTSSRENWPDGGVALHVADAAALITELAAEPCTVLGLSSGGVLALALAEAHPELVRRVLAWETPALTSLPDGPALHARLVTPMHDHLHDHPEDWRGAFAVMLMIMSGGEAEIGSPRVQRMMRNAEAAIRDDASIITAHRLTPQPGAADVVIAVGAGVDPLLDQIAVALAAAYGTPVYPVPAAHEHEIYLSRPEVLADAVAAARDSCPVPT